MPLVPLPKIPQEVSAAFQSQWADFSDAEDPVQLPPADSPEYHAQRIFVLSPGEVMGAGGLRTARAAGWRFLASGISSQYGIAASVAQRGNGWSLESVSYGPGIDVSLNAIRLLQPDLQALPDVYELRVLKIPSLLTEAFWLLSPANSQLDRVVPYLTRLAGIEPTRKYSEHEFLSLIRPYAKKRLEYANSPRASGDR